VALMGALCTVSALLLVLHTCSLCRWGRREHEGQTCLCGCPGAAPQE
jgi:hypothetical protein